MAFEPSWRPCFPFSKTAFSLYFATIFFFVSRPPVISMMNFGTRLAFRVEDLVEEVVGELFSERETPPESFRREGDGTAIVRGDLPIREANRELVLRLPEGDWSTVAGLCISLAGGIPRTGVRLRAGHVELEIVDADPRSVKLVRIRMPAHGTA